MSRCVTFFSKNNVPWLKQKNLNSIFYENQVVEEIRKVIVANRGESKILRRSSFESGPAMIRRKCTIDRVLSFLFDSRADAAFKFQVIMVILF